ncbi:hypothetical protein DFJ74DRAFT_202318 [Hyaloraphidium curvatum]|nr:hypothetical protein DFJ74DRAFT_202318 [Hyaloraphidium curvatum]
MPPKRGPADGGPHSPTTSALLRQIAELSGAINRRKAVDAAVAAAKANPRPPARPPGRPASAPPRAPQVKQAPQRPRHRTLVNNGGAPTASPAVPPPPVPSSATPSNAPSAPPPQWVKKRSHQLIRRSALPEVGAAAQASRKRILDSLAKAGVAPKTLPRVLPRTPATAALRTARPGATVEINGVAYRKSLRGNTFVRVGSQKPRTPPAGAAAGPPQRRQKMQTVLVNGVPYLRDPARPHKLVLRSAAAAQAPAALPKAVTLGGRVYLRTVNGNLRLAPSKPRSRHCTFHTLRGQCLRPKCRFLHVPGRVALCPLWLLRRPHPQGTECRLSHEPNANNTPLCRHFQAGRCRSGDDCRFAHVKLPDGAKVCAQFAAEGWCDRGAACTEKHYRVCPTEDEKGECGDPKCRLPHVARNRKARHEKAKATDQAGPPSVATEEGRDDDYLLGFEDLDGNNGASPLEDDEDDEEEADADMAMDMDLDSDDEPLVDGVGGGLRGRRAAEQAHAEMSFIPQQVCARALCLAAIPGYQAAGGSPAMPPRIFFLWQ